ncbi:S9 family peptidase [Flavobacterium sp. TAB 87]|uniref:alpha/beta hydrolase family protein n=1 Tax=Flavobacterium sp. TAB 87 TaxID=1729581 RepID=UPI00076DAC1F|nr:prolyl oligopeptidase family serine peptidase [Flavobacterium sp. TAB 87]KVV13988.1 Prolyl oligopeptidase family protein [Flavobacterium sp. TAB 87]
MQDIKLPYRKKPNRLHKVVLFFLWAAIYYFVIQAVPLMAQIKEKKQLSTDDYSQWSKLWPKKISDKGKWVSYALQYKLHQDTLFVQKTEGDKKYVFPNGSNGVFNQEEWFACLVKDTLVLKNLVSGTTRYTPNVASFFFNSNGKFLLTFLNDRDGRKQLIIKDMQEKVVEIIPNISSWKSDSSGNSIVYCNDRNGQYNVELIKFGKQLSKESIVVDNEVDFQNLVFRENTIAFTQKGKTSTKLFCFNNTTKTLFRYDPEEHDDFPADSRISDSYGSLTLSKDGRRVFFLIKEKNNDSNSDETSVQIWNTEDKQLYSNKKKNGFTPLRDKLAVWWPKDNCMLQITTKERPSAMLNGNYKYALTFDPLAYEPQAKFNSDRDIYITDLSNGSQKILLEKHSGNILTVLMSPNGKFISYTKNGDWWIYKISNGTHTNITRNIGVNFFREDNNTPGEAQMYGNIGWTENDKTVYVYDQFDIWEITPDGTSASRLTHGREKHLRFRVVPLSPEKQFAESLLDFNTRSFCSQEKLLLEAYDKRTETVGYYVWKRKIGEKVVVPLNGKRSHFMKTAKSEAFVYMEQTYEQAPTLVFQANSMVKPKVLVKSNPQQKNFNWGKSELVNYEVNGEIIRAALYYPAKYKKEQKYPMIVQIYERQSHYVNDYVNPSVYEQGGFNITNFTTQGYFVLLPDINYKFGDPGESAKICTIAATNEIINRGLVDSLRIGLIGHSFGGYETDFILTKTNKFAAAVSGAAWTDLVSTYFSIGESYLKPEFWRFEEHQLRIGKSFFEDMSSYIRNSPILNAEQITTPLLAWSGQKDRTISYHQSIEFYLALRTLKKKHLLLIYPNEDHAVVNEHNQKDLTERISEWFGYYLKSEKRKKWMDANNP